MSAQSKLAVAIVFAVFSTWFYFTPHLAVSSMRFAVETKDAAKLSGYVDFPAIKASVKASINARLASEIAKEQKGNPFAALGAALAASFINPMVDALVTPEGLAMMMKGDKPQPAGNPAQAKASDPDADTSMAYESFDRFVVTVKKKDTTEAPLGLVFNREGMFSWKLSALRLPL
ncbi:MAG: DUF2939 domain-containing protein [Thiobacillus sp.]